MALSMRHMVSVLAVMAVVAAMLAMTLAPGSASAQDSQCPEGSVAFEGNCYFRAASSTDCNQPGERAITLGSFGNVCVVDGPCPDGYGSLDGAGSLCGRLVPPPPPAEPTTKEQCKEDGFEEFANLGFKNQGECVAFVERGPEKGEKVPS